MPDANGKLYFSDFKAELSARGFDGFSDADLGTFVNRGYFAVARKARWEWEKATDSFTISPGAASVDLWPGGLELPYVRSVDRVYTTTTGFERKLELMSEEDFVLNWLSRDLTLTSFRGEPGWYYVYGGKLYVLNPPSEARSFIAHYHRRPAMMVGSTDQPITPIHLDEAIIDAARVRAHMRSNEPGLSSLARAELEEHFDDMRDDEEELMGEYQDRVSPDDSWL